MKNKISLIFSAATLLVCASAGAITTEKAKETYTWDTFQGNAGHQGYIPLSFSINGAETPVIKRLNADGFKMDHPVTIYQGLQSRAGECADPANCPDADFFYAPNLNQVTIKDGLVWVTNRGYRLSHHIWLLNQDSLTGSTYGWDYGLELDFNNSDPDSPTYWPNELCPISQSQPLLSNNRVYIASNMFTTSHSTFCGWDQSNDGLTDRMTYLRNHPYAVVKNSDGTSKQLLYFGDQQLISANQYDEFFAPAAFDGLIYTMGGGETDAVVDSGVYSFKDVSETSISAKLENQWSTLGGKGYASVLPNDAWSPAVNNDYVVSFAAKDIASLASGGTGLLSVFNRSSGEIAFSVDFDKYMPNDSVRYFHLNMAPVVVGDSVLVVNNSHLVSFSLAARNISVVAEDGFYGQPVTDGSTVFSPAYGGTTCASATTSCLTARLLSNLVPLSDSAGDRWVWNAPVGETITSNLVQTDSHVFLSTVGAAGALNTYAISTSTGIANASRESSVYSGIGGNLSFAFNTLYIAQSPVDEQHPDSFAAEDTIRPLSGAVVSTIDNDKSYVIAVPFSIDASISADMAVSGSVSSATAGTSSTITYTLSVSNNGTQDVDQDVNQATLSGDVPYGLTILSMPSGCSISQSKLACQLGAIAAGDASSVEISAIVGAVGLLDFDFEVDSELLDTDDSNNTFAIQVEGEPAPPTSYNISTSTSGSLLATSGEEVQVVVTFSNSGPERANDVIIESDIPSSLDIVNISSSSAGVTCSLSTATCVGSTIGLNESVAVTYTLRGINIGTYNLGFSAAAANVFSTDVDSTNNSASAALEITSAPVPGIGTGKKGGGSIDFAGILLLLGAYGVRRFSRVSV